MRINEVRPMNIKLLAIDLDGVLADFDKGVIEASGKPMKFWEQSDKLSVIWDALADLEVDGKGFYDWLDWMPDGKQLWNHVKPHKPVILTGLPRGDWAAPQKREWCARELGGNFVITCPSYQKNKFAMQYMERGDLENCVLIDDRIYAKEPWEKFGGTFIHHTSAVSSINDLNQLLTST